MSDTKEWGDCKHGIRLYRCSLCRDEEAMSDASKPPERVWIPTAYVPPNLNEAYVLRCVLRGDREDDHAYTLASSLPGSVEQIETAHTHIAAALDLLEFHEGSEKFIDGPDSNRVVWINAEGADGDFQVVLDLLRSALAAMKPKEEKP